MQFKLSIDYKRFPGRFGLLFVTLLFFTGIHSGNVLAEGSIKAGKEKARVCQVCHGEGGHSTKSTYPVLAGQHAAYIQKQLKAFKAGTRKDPIMNGQAAALTEQDMEDVAAFFQSNR